MKLKWNDCDEMATKILDGWRVKDANLTRRLAEIILRDGKAPKIRIFWDKKKEEVDFEIIK